ncbi:hypothetical protein AALP_AA3G329200 [Arabis alpina]|uniref:Uncharacterized protein n=1 Tax=Arabis alpina TaxID=50452 RepID=A0A087HD88_ARAAL|nr:hypothetical protein AALP_AA3G329200 [Arabis alpina]
MSISKSVVLLGARGLGSSFALINRRRPFPYRQISELTKNFHQEHLNSTLLQYETERLRRDMEKMRIELRSEIEKSADKFTRELAEAKNDCSKYCTTTLTSVVLLGIGILTGFHLSS